MPGGIQDYGCMHEQIRGGDCESCLRAVRKKSRGNGCHLDDWLMAEKIVKGRHAESTGIAIKQPRTGTRRIWEGKTEGPEVTAHPKKRVGTKEVTSKKTV